MINAIHKILASCIGAAVGFHTGAMIHTCFHMYLREHYRRQDLPGVQAGMAALSILMAGIAFLFLYLGRPRKVRNYYGKALMFSGLLLLMCAVFEPIHFFLAVFLAVNGFIVYDWNAEDERGA